MSSIKIRACTLCIRHEKVLLVEHKPFLNHKNFKDETFWALPGGRLKLGETIAECAERELYEETGMQGKTGNLLFLKELILPFPESDVQRTPKNHTLSLVFSCQITKGKLQTGKDPERGNDQLILKVEWIPINKLNMYNIYPNFLKKFILKGYESGFSSSNFPYIDSHG